MSIQKRRILFDTDFGSDVDDLIALTLALSSPEIEIVAITVVGRQSIGRAKIVEDYLNLVNDSIPVFVGEDEPLHKRGRFNWFGNEGKATRSFNQGQKSATEAIIDIFSSPTDVEIVAIGPLTNIAAAIKLNPQIAENMKKITIMGGQISEIRYLSRILPLGVDYNLCSDPTASSIVFSSVKSSALCLVTADVTLKVWMTEHDLNVIRKIDHPFIKAFIRDVDNWTPIQNSLFGNDPNNVAFLHDPLTVAAVFDRSFFTWKTLHIEPILIEDETNAAKSAFRTIKHESPQTCTLDVDCSVDVNAESFRQFLINRIVNRFSK